MRERALNPTTSFIVQAPAGSGKTELLTQRFLKLLSIVNKAPEEIVAITFTRKAAAEMRHRIMSALKRAQDPTPPEEAHKLKTWQLAQHALQRNQAMEWHLLDNPNRLRILTIDALATMISGQMPVMAHFGAKPDITDQAMYFYMSAAEQLLQTLSDNPPWKPALESLLLQVNNQCQRLIELLARLLAKREQWLPHIMACHQQRDEIRKHLEKSLTHCLDDAICAAYDTIDKELQATLITIFQQAALDCQDQGVLHPITCFENHHSPLLPNHQDEQRWRAVASLLLNKTGEWRSSFTKREGFSTKSTHKTALLSLLPQLHDNDDLLLALQHILLCPAPQYEHQQWLLIDALITVLPLLTAYLDVIFQEQGVVDFVELNLAALRALGDSDSPTDLALYWDYQIQHLLVDEFQDTSITQFTLLEKLTAGWQPDDGKTLFLVGDPMQSIYRFRDAEVSLFLRAEQFGINDISLEKLTLDTNFRSQANIVEWVNNVFTQVFPSKDQMATGAIAYTPSIAAQQSTQHHTSFNPIWHDDESVTAQAVVQRIQTLQQDHPRDSIAILVRARRHLADIVVALKQHQIAYHAVELEKLSNAPAIQDLLSLTRALTHHADRTAWLSILRAPFCGLLLNDLLYLCEHANKHTLWSALVDYENISQLSNDAQCRLQRIVPILNRVIQEQGRLPIANWIRGAWCALGGPASYDDSSQLEPIADYFDCLANYSESQPIFILSEFITELDKHFIERQAPPGCQLHIMTIHKAKGLEFDHVILPALNKSPNRNSPSLLLWQDRPTQQGHSELIFAPIKAIQQDKDPIYHYLDHQEQEKLHLESARLLYVAVTRAKQSLHLYANITVDTKKNLAKINHKSFLQMLSKYYHDALIPPNQPQQLEEISHSPPLTEKVLTRLKSQWQIPKPYRTALISPIASPNPFSLKLESPFPRALGTVIHHLLYHIESEQSYDLKALTQQGVAHFNRLHSWTKDDIHQAQNTIHLALTNCLTDARGRWILSNTHLTSYREWALTALIQHKPRQLVIDRCFEDDDYCWIIDYKTSTPEQESLERFLLNEKATYAEQLRQYSDAVRPLTTKKIRTGLYFPLCCGWIEEVEVDYA